MVFENGGRISSGVSIDVHVYAYFRCIGGLSVPHMIKLEKRFSETIAGSGVYATDVPSIMPIADYFIARAPEVIKLYNSMKHIAESVLRNKRRRVRSFRPYHSRPKFPKKCIFPRSMSRRTSRKRRLYLREPPGKKSRLPLTHVWHGKRFKMEELWNMRLPVHVSDKGQRAINRRAQQGCVLHDRSYLDCWKFEGGVTAEELNKAGFPSSINHSKVKEGILSCSGFILSGDSPTIISTFQAMYVSDCLHVWTHPSARRECRDLIEAIGGALMTRAARFELMGARALDVLNKVFGTKFTPIECVPGKLLFDREYLPNACIITRDGGRVMDAIFIEENDKVVFSAWLKLAATGISPIGVEDRRLTMLHRYAIPDFPYDFPESKAGIREAARHTKKHLDHHARMPKQCKMNTTTVESPFFPDWSLVRSLGNLKRVCVTPLTRGNILRNAHIYLNNNLVGYITSASADARQVGIGSIAADNLEGVVEIKNPGALESFVAKLTMCHGHTDSPRIGLLEIK